MTVFDQLIKLPERLLKRDDTNWIGSVRLGRLRMVCKLIYDTSGISAYKNLEEWAADIQYGVGGRAREDYKDGLRAYAAYKDNQNQEDNK